MAPVTGKHKLESCQLLTETGLLAQDVQDRTATLASTIKAILPAGNQKEAREVNKDLGKILASVGAIHDQLQESFVGKAKASDILITQK